METKILEKLEGLVERLNHPGVLGLHGGRIERSGQAAVAAYFRHLQEPIRRLHLENIQEGTKDMVRHAVESRLSNVLRINRHVLLFAIADHLQKGILAAWKEEHIKESDDDGSDSDVDQVGPSAERAAEIAAEQAAEAVKNIDATTVDQIASAVSTAIKEQLGVPGASRLIRQTVEDMSSWRAKMIATTEINQAMSDAALEKMKSLSLEYKQIINSPDCCDICAENADVDPLPVDEDYPSGDDGPPFHPNCRCGITGARAPEDDE
jgi:hypothetical protein